MAYLLSIQYASVLSIFAQNVQTYNITTQLFCCTHVTKSIHCSPPAVQQSPQRHLSKPQFSINKSCFHAQPTPVLLTYTMSLEYINHQCKKKNTPKQHPLVFQKADPSKSYFMYSISLSLCNYLYILWQHMVLFSVSQIQQKTESMTGRFCCFLFLFCICCCCCFLRIDAYHINKLV